MWGTKLPKKEGGRYLVTLVTGSYGGTQVRQADCVKSLSGTIGWCILPECSNHYGDDVIAWMKQPKPYDPKKGK
jgi:hypothetical protein